MDGVFKLVYEILKWLSDFTGFTYREMNIMVYFILIPFTFFVLIDKILGKHFFKIGFSIIVVLSLFLVGDFETFSNRLFDRSVHFLNWFEVLGWNYTQASVIICVFVPLFFFLLLLFIVKRYKEKTRRSNP